MESIGKDIKAYLLANILLIIPETLALSDGEHVSVVVSAIRLTQRCAGRPAKIHPTPARTIYLDVA
jgi:hypothetical protein